jgi:6-phosphogluconolactonase
LTALPSSPFPDTGLRPPSITFDPSGQYTFVSNSGSQNVSVFSVNPATGQLSPIGTPISAGTAPGDLITDATGAHLYVEDGLANVLYAYGIADDGTLSPFSPPTFPSAYSPSYPALSPNGRFLYLPSFDAFPQGGATTSTVTVYSINPATGALAQIIGSPFVTGIDAGSIAIDPSGNFAYVPNGFPNIITGYSLNSATGFMSPLPATFPAGEDPSIMIFVKTNQSCVATSCAANFYQISGTISGLTGTGLVLQDNAGNALPISAGATSFAFATLIASGGRYNVSVLTQPSNPPQTCTVTNGSGTVANANITNVQVTCTAAAGTFAYVTNQGNGVIDGSLGVYSIGAAGSLTQLTSPTVPAHMQPFALVADPTGQWLFVTDLTSGAMFTYQINAQTGALTQSATTSIGASTSVVINPSASGAWLYATVPVGAAGIYAFSVNGVTGALTPVNGSPFASLGSRPTNIVLDPTGQFAFVSNNASGTVTAFSINSIGFGHSLYVMDDLATVIRAFSIAGNGSLAPLSTPVFQGVSNPLLPTVSPNGQFLYVPNWVNGGTVPGGTVSVFSVNQSTGILGAIVGSPFTTGMEPASVAIDSLGQFAYVANQAPNNISVFTLNSSSGAMTLSSTASAGEVPTRIAIVQPN